MIFISFNTYSSVLSKQAIHLLNMSSEKDTSKVEEAVPSPPKEKGKEKKKKEAKKEDDPKEEDSQKECPFSEEDITNLVSLIAGKLLSPEVFDASSGQLKKIAADIMIQKKIIAEKPLKKKLSLSDRCEAKTNKGERCKKKKAKGAKKFCATHKDQQKKKKKESDHESGTESDSGSGSDK